MGSSQVLANAFVAALESNEISATNTGIAVMNLEEGEVQLELSLCDSEGNPIATAQLTLAGMGHRARFVNELDWQPAQGVELDFSDFNGLLKVTTSGRVAATVIQSRPGEFATMPVAANPFAAASSSTLQSSVPLQNQDLDQKLYFAQFGDGQAGGADTFSQIILFNLDSNEKRQRESPPQR